MQPHNKTPYKTIRGMQRIYDGGSTLVGTADELKVSYSTARRYVERPRQLKRSNFATRSQYRDALARRKGYNSDAHYEEALALERQSRPENIAFSTLLRDSLGKKGKSDYWLAKIMDLSEKMIYKYLQGISLPSSANFQRLSELFGWSYESIDDLVADTRF